MTAITAASLLHVAVSAGAGVGHGFVGSQLELRDGHFALDGGVGVLDVPFADIGDGADWHVSPALGLRDVR